MRPQDAAVWLHTVRYLDPVQIVERIRRHLLGPPHGKDVPGKVRLRGVGLPVPPLEPSRDRRVGRRFQLINETANLADESWRAPGMSRLWNYHLHYFDYLFSTPEEDDLALILHWIDRNPPLSVPGWEPYPISLRVRSWLEWLAARYPQLPSEHRSRILYSIASQVETLRWSVEYHLMGNHLLENAITLVWAGLRLRCVWSAGWIEQGMELLQRELAKQVLRDGLHEERSPAYHGVLTHALLRLWLVASRIGGPDAERVREVLDWYLPRMLRALHRMSHADGRVALFNDGGLAWAPPCDAMQRAYREPAQSPTQEREHLDSSGYFILKNQQALLLFDCGSIGPDHQPGHGHADALSFELSRRGVRLCVDTGVSTYEPGAARSYQRSVAAHNTIQVGNGDQCDLWGAFRCGRRPKVWTLDGCAGEETGDRVAGGRVAVKTTRGPAYEHIRLVALGPSGVKFRDTYRAETDQDLKMRVHLAPGVRPEIRQEEVRLYHEGKRVAIVRAGDGEWECQSSSYHPDFNVELERSTLLLKLGKRHEAVWSWFIRWPE